MSNQHQIRIIPCLHMQHKQGIKVEQFFILQQWSKWTIESLEEAMDVVKEGILL
jgi:hypothetical protein